MITYRLIKKEDNHALAILIRRIFEEFDVEKRGTVYSDPTTDDLFSLFDCQNSELWVAEENGCLMGCCGLYPTKGLPEGCAELVKYYLAPEARGKGIGFYLLSKTLERAKLLEYSSLYLESFPQFEKAVSIYEDLGFERLESPMGNSGHDACTIWMIKKV